MAFDSKYSGRELEEKLDSIDNIPSLVSQMIASKEYVTNSELQCILTNYAPADYHTIPIDGITIYWDKGILKAAGGGGKDSYWELKKTESGVEYLYSKYHVLTGYGITMYGSGIDGEGNNGDFILSYKDIPIDNDTIYWGDKNGKEVLKAKGGGDSNFFIGHYDDNGNLLYIEATKDIAINGGLTMFIDNGTIDLPQLYEGLNIDNDTIYWEQISGSNEKVLKAKILNNTGEGTLNDIETEGEGNAFTSAYLNDTKDKIIFNKDFIFAQKKYVDDTFFPFTGGTITGDVIVQTSNYNKITISEGFISHYSDLMNFDFLIRSTGNIYINAKDYLNIKSNNGITINGGELKYNSTYKYWELKGDLLVNGAITQFASSTIYTPSTVMDSLILDDKTLNINDDGKLSINYPVKIVQKEDNMNESNVLYVIV